MPGPSHQTEAHVLARHAHAGDHVVLTCFAATDGLLTAFLRLPRSARPNTPAPPDLFDRINLTVERGRTSANNGPWFVREHRLLIRYAGIGRDFAPLAAASRFARLVSQNPGPEDSRANIDHLLTQAFAAFARSEARPDLVYFKSLYLLVRDEGLPLKQEWAAALRAEDRQLVAVILQARADAPDAAPSAEVIRLTTRLETYLHAEHDFRLP